MRAEFEIVDRYREKASCEALLYAPLEVDLTYRESRRYIFDITGGEKALERFVRRSLFDAISQELYRDTSPWTDHGFCLEYGMKKGALDLEKEAILNYYRSLENPGFAIEAFEIRHRLYVFGEGASEFVDRIVRDVVNPAIHTHSVEEVEVRSA